MVVEAVTARPSCVNVQSTLLGPARVRGGVDASHDYVIDTEDTAVYVLNILRYPNGCEELFHLPGRGIGRRNKFRELENVFSGQ